MNKVLLGEKIKSLVPYLFLAIAIIVAWRLIDQVGAVLDIARQAWGILTPFFYGFLLAYLFNMPIASVQKLLIMTGNGFVIRRQRMFSILIVLLLTAGIIALTLVLIIPAIRNSINIFIENIPGYTESVVAFIDNFNQMDLFGLTISADGIFDMLGAIFTDFSAEYLMAPINAIVGAGAAMFTAVLTFISSIYFLVEKERGAAVAKRMLKLVTTQQVFQTTLEILGRLDNNFRQYIRTQTIDGLILGTMATILLWILGSPFALILGIILGIFNYIPYFGSIAATLIAVVVVAFTDGMTMGLIALIALFVIQQIDANIIQPRLMSGSFSLSPLLVIISITFGGAMAGIVGMIVAIPIVAVLKDIFDYIVAYCEIRKFGRSQKEENNNG